MLKSPIVLGVSLLFVASIAHAQERPEAGQAARVSATVGGLVSFQPATQQESGPYMNNAVAGTVPGFVLGVAVSQYRGWSMALESSVGSTIETVQTGRFSAGPTVGKHRDSFISLLPGYRHPHGGWSLTYVAGPSYVLSRSEKEGLVLNNSTRYGNIGGTVALGGGLDMATDSRSRAALIASIRYFYVFRGDEVFYIGLGHNVVRVAAGVRFALRR